MGLSRRCGLSSGPNGPDIMFLSALKVARSVMKGVTRGLARVLPCGKMRRGTCGQIRGRRSPQLSLTTLWLHGFTFNGPIPKNIGELTSLKDLYGAGKSN